MHHHLYFVPKSLFLNILIYKFKDDFVFIIAVPRLQIIKIKNTKTKL